MKKKINVFINLLVIMFSFHVQAQTVVAVNMKADKLQVNLPAKDSKSAKLRTQSEIQVRICNPLLTQELINEINQYQSAGKEIPQEKLQKSFPFTYYESVTDLGINYYVGVLPFPSEMNEETCLWNMTVAFTKKFDKGFSGNNCNNQLEKGAYTDVNGKKRNVRTCICQQENKFLVYKVYYFDDRIYFLTAYGNGILQEGSKELNEISKFFTSFSDK